MFEYAREKFTKDMVITEEKLKLLEKEKTEKETKLEIVDEFRYRKKLVKMTNLFCIPALIVLGIYLGPVVLVGGSMTYILSVIGVVLPNLVKNAKEMPGLIGLSNKELLAILSSLYAEIKSLNYSIDTVSKKLDEYKNAIKFFDVSDRVLDSLDNLDYAYKYAKDEEEYNDMCEKQMFCQEEWDKFVSEPVDYRNTHLVLNEPNKEEVKKLTKSYGKI